MSKEINTVGDLRELLNCCEDEEPITCYVEGEDILGVINLQCRITGASSTAGGRAVNLWLEQVKHQKVALHK